MRKLARFAGGCLFGSAFLALATLVPSPAAAQTEIVLVCSGDNCCTVNSSNGEIIDCKKVRP